MQNCTHESISDKLKEVIYEAIMVVGWRAGDISNENGNYSTTDCDSLIRLESALCSWLGTSSDDIDLREAIELLDAKQMEEPDNDPNYCALQTVTDEQVRKVVYAFWRRIYPFRNNYDRELPRPIPTEFMAHMATALTWIDKQRDNYKCQLEIVTEQRNDLLADLHVIANTSNLTATPKQFASYLQNAAKESIARLTS